MRPACTSPLIQSTRAWRSRDDGRGREGLKAPGLQKGGGNTGPADATRWQPEKERKGFWTRWGPAAVREQVAGVFWEPKLWKGRSCLWRKNNSLGRKFTLSCFPITGLENEWRKVKRSGKKNPAHLIYNISHDSDPFPLTPSACPAIMQEQQRPRVWAEHDPVALPVRMEMFYNGTVRDGSLAGHHSAPEMWLVWLKTELLN